MQKNNSLHESSYRFSTSIRIIVVFLVSSLAVLTALGVLPLAKLMGVNPSHLQGISFQPTFKTMTVVLLYSASQFLLILLVMRFIHRKKVLSLGFNRPFWKPFLIGSAIGIGLAVAELSIDALIGGNISMKWAVPADVSVISVIGHFLLWLLFLLTLNSLKEELVFRAYPIELFNDHPQAFIWIIIFISLLFAAIHHIIEPFSLSAFLSRFSIAIVFAYTYYRWRSIWLIVGIHNGTNFIGFLFGGMWKSGGLFEFEFTSPSSEIIISVDLAVKLLALALIHYVWKKANMRKING